MTQALAYSMIADDGLSTEFRDILSLDDLFGELIAGYGADSGYPTHWDEPGAQWDQPGQQWDPT